MTTAEEIQGRMRTLLQELIDRTEAGKVAWSETDAKDAYLHSEVSTSAIISRLKTGISNYELRVLNRRGTVVATLTTARVKTTISEGKTMSSPAPWNEMLERLFRSARLSALNPLGAIDSMLGDLREPDDGESE